MFLFVPDSASVLFGNGHLQRRLHLPAIRNWEELFEWVFVFNFIISRLSWESNHIWKHKFCSILILCIFQRKNYISVSEEYLKLNRFHLSFRINNISFCNDMNWDDLHRSDLVNDLPLPYVLEWDLMGIYIVVLVGHIAISFWILVSLESKSVCGWRR